MNIGFGLNLVSLLKPNASPTQAQITNQAAQGGGIEGARDRVVRQDRQRASMNLVGVNIIGQRRVLDKAGITKVCATKKR